MAKRILVVDDEESIQELMSSMLAERGYETVRAMDGEEGLKKLETFKPDIILLDLILPGLDGFETLERIKDNPQTSGIPVLILSNLGQRDEIEKGLKLGAIDFMVKAHFTPEEIVGKIKSILSKKGETK